MIVTNEPVLSPATLNVAGDLQAPGKPPPFQLLLRLPNQPLQKVKAALLLQRCSTASTPLQG
jgi:hypothetical protein